MAEGGAGCLWSSIVPMTHTELFFSPLVSHRWRSLCTSMMRSMTAVVRDSAVELSGLAFVPCRARAAQPGDARVQWRVFGRMCGLDDAGSNSSRAKSRTVRRTCAVKNLWPHLRGDSRVDPETVRLFLFSFQNLCSKLPRLAMHEYTVLLAASASWTVLGAVAPVSTTRQRGSSWSSSTTCDEFMERVASLDVARVHWRIFGRMAPNGLLHYRSELTNL